MKKKIIVSALALMAGFGLVGSVTSTIAWYQYSTKTTAALVGVAGGTKGNLQMRIRAEGQQWTTKITKEQMATYLGSKSIVPVTSGQMQLKDNFLGNLYCNPIYGYAEQTSWKQAEAKNYITLPLELRFHEVNDSGEANVAKDIYLSDLFLAQDASDTLAHGDLSSAIRFHISAYSQEEPSTTKQNRFISKNGGQINACGYLDLNADGEDDVSYTEKSDKYGFTNGAGTKISYGGTGATQTMYSANVNTGTNPILADLANGIKDGDRKLGTTLEANDKFLSVDVTIWVEGWQPLPEGTGGKTIWNAADFANAKFDVGFEFEADL